MVDNSTFEKAVIFAAKKHMGQSRKGDKFSYIIHPMRVYISFKVSTKSTGETVEITRLKKRDVKQASKFKFDDIQLKLHNPDFELEDLESYKVKSSFDYVTGG